MDGWTIDQHVDEALLGCYKQYEIVLLNNSNRAHTSAASTKH